MPSGREGELAGEISGAGRSDWSDWREVCVRETRRSRRVSWLLDECIRVPGTRLRFGLDPLLGLLPYGGEAVATIMGTLILSDAGSKGLPLATLVRMGGNMVVNAAIGAIPVVGDLFSFWFKSNSRNYALLNTYLESEHGAQARGGWWPVILIVTVIGTVVAINLLAWVLLWSTISGLWRSLTALA